MKPFTYAALAVLALMTSLASAAPVPITQASLSIFEDDHEPRLMGPFFARASNPNTPNRFAEARSSVTPVFGPPSLGIRFTTQAGSFASGSLDAAYFDGLTFYGPPNPGPLRFTLSGTLTGEIQEVGADGRAKSTGEQAEGTVYGVSAYTELGDLPAVAREAALGAGEVAVRTVGPLTTSFSATPRNPATSLPVFIPAARVVVSDSDGRLVDCGSERAGCGTTWRPSTAFSAYDVGLGLTLGGSITGVDSAAIDAFSSLVVEKIEAFGQDGILVPGRIFSDSGTSYVPLPATAWLLASALLPLLGLRRRQGG